GVVGPVARQRRGGGGGARGGAGATRDAHTFSERSSPTMPLGRTSRIRIMARNAKVSLYSVMPGNSAVRGNRAVRKFSRKPSSTPPTTAPGRLPMPPMTAAANALMPGKMPKMAGWLMLPKVMPHITAAAAASMEPSRKVVAMTRSTFTPIMRAVSASWAVARMALPRRVRVTNSVRLTTRTAVTSGTSTIIHEVNSVSPATCTCSGCVQKLGGRNGVWRFENARMPKFCRKNDTAMAVMSIELRGAPRAGGHAVDGHAQHAGDEHAGHHGRQPPQGGGGERDRHRHERQRPAHQHQRVGEAAAPEVEDLHEAVRDD